MNRVQRRHLSKIARTRTGRQISDDLENLTYAVLDGTLSPADAVNAARREAKAGVVIALARLGAPAVVIREALITTWHGAHQGFGTALDRDELVALFRLAEFELPAALPETMTVWRGTSGLSLERARQGLSWSLSRDVACHFATDFWQRHGTPGAPVVLRRKISRSDVLFYSNALQQAEVVIGCDPGGEVDGDPAEDWRAASQRLLAQMAATTHAG